MEGAILMSPLGPGFFIFFQPVIIPPGGRCETRKATISNKTRKLKTKSKQRRDQF